jgi:hypothetical protein
MTLEEHKQVLQDAEYAVMDTLEAYGSVHHLTGLEWIGVLTQCLFRQLATALANEWEGRAPQ